MVKQKWFSIVTFFGVATVTCLLQQEPGAEVDLDWTL
jgi:hypothetical protein